MKTENLIEGLQILAKYRDKPGYDVGAEHDAIYAFATDRPVERADLERLIELDWFQEDAEYDDEFTAEHYAPEESWTAYV
jgi:hypothetical protein